MKNKKAQCHPDKSLYAKQMCRSCYEKNLRQRNPKYAERQRQNTERWVKNNKEQKKKSDANWRAKQDKGYLALQKRAKLLESYNMTFEDYDCLFKQQKGKCFICRKEVKGNLHIDHCHDTGTVRGLLCFRCNFGLSYFGEDKDNFIRVVEYLTRGHPLK